MEGTNFYTAGARLLKEASSPSPSAAKSARSFNELREQTVVFTIICILIALVVVFSILTVREYLASLGVSCCQPRRRREALRRVNGAIRRGTNQAMDVRRNNGDAVRERTLQRLERRSWYEYYLTKFMHTVTESDFVEDDLNRQDSQTPSCEVSKCLSVVCNDGSKRVVDACCCICLGTYEVGDTIVRSPLDQCPHVYHHDCLMPWLVKGKKRCPTCRHWFVPSTKISDQILAEFGDTTSSTETTEGADDVGYDGDVELAEI